MKLAPPSTPLKFLKFMVLSFQGNYENKFTIDEESGEIKVVEPLKQRDGRTGRSFSEIEPVITLQVIIMLVVTPKLLKKPLNIKN